MLTSQLDFRASLISCLSGCGFFPLALSVVSYFKFDSFLLPFQIIASFVLGPSVISAESNASFPVLGYALLILSLWCFAFGFLTHFLLHRWGILVGIVGGALLGLCAFAITFKMLPYFFEWSRAFLRPAFAVAFLAFGAWSGGVYESLEEEPEN
ncbi:MAG: hypothetical protein SFU91_04260 [Chloroherpetonaceae bacterium]|nr:hypothetical protein [Chloroherpetonaceae bacterium]